MHILFYTGHNIFSTQGLSTGVSAGLIIGAFLGFLSVGWIFGMERQARAQRTRGDELVKRVIELRERVAALERGAGPSDAT